MTEFEETSKKIQDLVDEVFKQGIGVGYDHGLEVGTQNGYKRGYENGKKSEQTDDAISRQAVQDYIAKYLSQYLYDDVREAVEVIDEYIGELPSVKQEPKTGHWMPIYGNVKCSVCGSVKESRRVGKATHYCDFCGAKMESEG